MLDNKVQIILTADGSQAITVTKEIGGAFKTLQTTSVAEINKKKAEISAAYNTIKNAGVASSEEIKHAWAAKNKAIADLDRELEAGQTSLLSKIKQHWLAVTAAIAGAVVVANKIKDYIVDVAHMAGRYEMLGISMKTAGQNAGYSAGQMDAFEAKLRETGIAAIEARQTLSRMAASQMDLAESAKLARAAQDLAVVGGINSSEAFERLIYAVQSAQVEMVRTIGLNVSFEQGYKKTAAQLGVNTMQLTEYQKTQSRVNTVLEAAAKYQGIYEKSMSSAEKQNLSLKRIIDDYKVAFGEAFQPAYLRMVEAKTEAYKNLKKAVSDPEFQENLKAIADIFATIYEWASKIPSAISHFISGAREAAKIAAEWHLNLPALVFQAQEGPPTPTAVIPPREMWAEGRKKEWMAIYEAAEKTSTAIKKVKTDTSAASEEAKKLAESWKNISRELEKKIILMDLEGFDRQRKEIELEVDDLRKKLGDEPIITKYFDAAMAKAQKDEIKKLMDDYQADLQKDEDKIIEEAKKRQEGQRQTEEESWKLAEEACVAREKLEENLTEVTVDELGKRLLEVGKWVEEQDRLNALSAKSYEEYEDRKTRITEASEKMKAKITEDYAKDQQREYEKALMDMENFFEDVFVGKQKNMWQALLDWMKGAFYRFVAQLMSRQIIIPIIAQIIPTGGVANAAAGAVTGQTGGLGSLSSLGGLGSMFGQLGSLIGDFGGMLLGSMAAYESFMVNLPNIFSDATFNAISGVLGTITPFLPLIGPLISGLSGNWGGLIGGLAGFGGSLALGATLGSIIPGIGTLIGGILGSILGNIFGGGDEPELRLKYHSGEEGNFDVARHEIDGHKLQNLIQEQFQEFRKSLLKFAEGIGLDTENFRKNWEGSWREIHNKEDLEAAIQKWAGNYARFVTGINFKKFQKEGEDIITTIGRIITAVGAVPDVLESFRDYIGAIRGSYDAIAKWKEQMSEARDQIKEVRESLKKATDPADAVNYANQLKQAIYQKYLLEKQLVEGLVESIKVLKAASLDFQISLQQKLDDLLGTSKSISLLREAMDSAFKGDTKKLKGDTPQEKMANLQKYIGYLDQWVAENLAAIEKQYQVHREALQKQLDLANQWKGILESVHNQILDMKSSTASPATARQRLDYLRSEMDRVRALYLESHGEKRAEYASELQQLIAQYMGLAQEVYQRPSPQYQAIYDEMNGWLHDIQNDARAHARSAEDILKKIQKIDDDMAADIKAFKKEAAQYYRWAMDKGARLYEKAIREQTNRLEEIIGDKTVEEYLARLQEHAVDQLRKIRDLLKEILHNLVPEAFQEGAYVSHRTLAWVGEKEPEWIIPKSKVGMLGGQTITIAPQITIQATSNADAKKIAKATEEAIINSFKYGKGRQVLKEVLQHG